jgi:hypothetical protein
MCSVCLFVLPQSQLKKAKFLSGADAQMEFMARNYNALRHKYTLHADYLEQMNFNTDKAAAAHIAIANSTPTTTAALNGTSFSLYNMYINEYVYTAMMH